MPIKDITHRIRKDAEAEKERILEEARTEAHRIRNGYQLELDARVTELKVRAGKERDSMSEMIVSRAGSGVSRKKLEEKERLIGETVSTALENLRALPDSEYQALLERLYRNGLELAGKDSRVIPCTTKDAAAFERLGVKAVGSGMGKDYGHTGGVIVESPDGRIRVDNSFEALVERKRLDLKIQVSDILFAEKDRI